MGVNSSLRLHVLELLCGPLTAPTGWSLLGYSYWAGLGSCHPHHESAAGSPPPRLWCWGETTWERRTTPVWSHTPLTSLHLTVQQCTGFYRRPSACPHGQMSFISAQTELLCHWRTSQKSLCLCKPTPASLWSRTQVSAQDARGHRTSWDILNSQENLVTGSMRSCKNPEPPSTWKTIYSVEEK